MPEVETRTSLFRRMKLHHWIFVGMGIGFGAGLALHNTLDPESAAFKHAVWWLDLLGKDIFIGSLKMIIAPLIFASIVAGIGSLPDMKEVGNIGWKTLAYYVATTSIAVSIGLAAVLLIRPGKQEGSQALRAERQKDLDRFKDEFAAKNPGVDPDAPGDRVPYMAYVASQSGERAATDAQFASKWKTIQAKREMGPLEMFKHDILEPILTNPFKSLAELNSLGIIFFAILTGLACMAVGPPAAPVLAFFKAFNEVMLKVTLWVMGIAPVAIGCILASLLAKLGTAALESLWWYSITVVAGIAVHVAVLLTLVAVLGRMNPLVFWRGIWSAWLIAFSTTSSAATLPVTLECVTEELKVSRKVANFALPVGATVNMDGTALYEGVAVIFMLQVYGGLADVPIDLGGAKIFVIFLTAVVASVGAAAVPSAGLITMAIVAEAVGLPVYYIPFIFAVDHLLDMFRTSTNVLGDAVGAVIVNRLEARRLGDDAADNAEPPG
ncbi:MAG: dicarboxylate/amino acid:cation symporter [Planctomycetota bacterium]|nr:dicarboxylate/amino acid:cation symporter [Planctomycetota bacterium]